MGDPEPFPNETLRAKHSATSIAVRLQPWHVSPSDCMSSNILFSICLSRNEYCWTIEHEGKIHVVSLSLCFQYRISVYSLWHHMHSSLHQDKDSCFHSNMELLLQVAAFLQRTHRTKCNQKRIQHFPLLCLTLKHRQKSKVCSSHLTCE